MLRKGVFLSVIMIVIVGLFACSTPSEETTTTAPGITFPDSNLEAAIRVATSKPEGPIYTVRLEKLTTLSLSGRDITDLTGLEHCINLERLELDGNQITDISPLASLTKLTELVIEHDQIADLSPLADRRNLTVLWAFVFPDPNLDAAIREVMPVPGGAIVLSELENITTLSLAGKDITDLTGLEHCINLESLELEGNEIVDISPLLSLENLIELVLEPGQIEDLSLLTFGADITILWAVNFPDQNLEAAIREAIPKPKGPIYTSELEDLTTLSLVGTTVGDLTGMEYCINLESLEIYDSNLRDISPLASLTNLARLYLNRSQILDMSPLAVLTDLDIIRAVEFPDQNLEAAIRQALRTQEYSVELPWEAREITEIWWDFSFKHPTDWTDNTTEALYAAMAPGGVTGLFVTTWGVGQGSTLTDVLGNAPFIRALDILYAGDTTLADGTPANVVEYNATLGDTPMHMYSFGAIRKGKWTAINIWNIDQYAPYNRTLFMEIAHTLRFTQQYTTGSIYTLDLEKLTSLSISEGDITNLGGLEFCVNLERLEIADNQIKDISPIAALTNLTRLDLHNNEISDISPLSSLDNLTELWLQGNWVNDISPLLSLTNLTWLYLHDNQIRNISRLSSLDNLTELWLCDNWISDISSLASLDNLTRLYLHENQIENVTPLASLTNLSWLSLHNNPITDISSLVSLDNLAVLILDPGQLIDISPLDTITDLIVLWAVTFPDENLELVIRETINRPEGPIYTLELQGITSLTLSDENITNLTGLEYCTNLKRLEIYDTWVSDISPLSSLTNLTRLYLQDNQLTDISPLASLAKLVHLHLQDNRITDLTPLSSLTNLAELWLQDNRISDISPLVENSGLSELDVVNLMNNLLNDASIGIYIPELEQRGVTVSQ